MNKRDTCVLENYIAIQDIFKIFKDEKDAVFLDSSLKNNLGKFSVIGLYPYLNLVRGKEFRVNGKLCNQSFEEFVRSYLKENQEVNDTKLPIVSGAIGYFSYEYGRNKEKVKTRHDSELEIPQCILNFYDVFIIEDHQNRKVTLVANGRLKDSRKMLKDLYSRIINAVPEPITQAHHETASLTSNFEKKEYLNAIQSMIDYIVEGDIYIANMTQQLVLKSERLPFDTFLRLRERNPSPFGGYFNYDEFQIISSSPERFLKMEDGRVQTRPIKGTRKRGATESEDRRLRDELYHSEKDRSELLMIVDLERNDLNRVCKPHTVKVSELFSIEEYSTVFHLVANIEGELKESMNAMDLIEAAFPGGSITGAPKHRAMEIIDELEHSQRSIYTGSMGYLTLDGCCDFNIMIRTALYKDGIYHLGVGGGITCESDLEFEYEETLQKASAVLKAIQ